METLEGVLAVAAGHGGGRASAARVCRCDLGEMGPKRASKKKQRWGSHRSQITQEKRRDVLANRKGECLN